MSESPTTDPAGKKSSLPESQSFSKEVWSRMRKNPMTMLAYRVVVFLALVALLSDFIAYNKPIYCQYKGETYWPLFNDYLSSLGLYQWDGELINEDWRDLELESAFWTPVRYLPNDLDYNNMRLTGPFDDQNVSTWKYWHFLGTDRDGRDVLSGLVHGTRISLTIGLVAMGIATFIGLLVGAMAGYFGDDRLQLSVIGILFFIIGLILGLFYGFQVRAYVLADALESNMMRFAGEVFLSLLIVVGSVIAALYLAKPLEKIPFLGQKRYIWVDIIFSRIMEILTSIPSLLLIITILAITETQSIYTIMVIIGLLAWTSIARFMRGEMLRTRSMEYIQAARSLGYSEWRVLFRHAVPNSLAPVLVVIAFGVAGAITLEAGLSFLGIGVPEDVVTWGKMLNSARIDINAWWLSVFPGLAIFLTVTFMNLLGEGLQEALNPKSRS